jgi:rhodanese-related sulfurtransferase
MTTIVQTSPADLHDALARGEVLLIDVREPHEYAAERIPGALLYPLSTFDPQAVPNVPGRKIVLQCAGGVRSMRAAQALASAGVTGLHNLDGGINAWKAQGLPLIVQGKA